MIARLLMKVPPFARLVRFLGGIAVLGALALLTSGCELTQYEAFISSCSTANGKTQITIYLKRDGDQQHDDSLRADYLQACKAIGGAP